MIGTTAVVAEQSGQVCSVRGRLRASRTPDHRILSAPEAPVVSSAGFLVVSRHAALYVVGGLDDKGLQQFLGRSPASVSPDIESNGTAQQQSNCN
jgi:hypothetical protein